MEKTKKKDFIELEFTARIKESGIIFDTNIKEDAKSMDINSENLKPLKICIGQEMVVRGLDKELENKEVGEKCKINVTPEDGFGMRNPKLIRIIPMKVFIERNINPVKGLILNMDGMIARIASVSGGRVTIGLNNPLSGKIVQYDFVIKRIIKEEKEKIISLTRFFCGEEPDEKDIVIEGKKAEIRLKSKINTEFLRIKIKDTLGLEAEIKDLENPLAKSKHKVLEALENPLAKEVKNESGKELSKNS